MRTGATLAATLEDAAREWPDAYIDFATLGERLTYARLLEESCLVAGGLRARRLGRGDHVGLLFGTGPDFLRSFFGVLLAGGVPTALPVPASMSQLPAYRERLEHILRDGGVRLLLADRAFVRHLRGLVGSVALLEVAELMESRPVIDSETSPSDIGLVQYTSGSTSDPKGIVLTNENVLAGLEAIVAGLKITRADSNGQWVPVHHDMGLIGMLVGVYMGGYQSIWSPGSFLRNPYGWLREFARRRCTIYAGPNFSYDMMLRGAGSKDLGDMDLSALRVAMNGAEHVEPDTMTRFFERFGAAGLRPEVLMPVYGLAEVTLAAAFPVLGEPLRIEVVDRESLRTEGRARLVERHHPNARALASVGEAVIGHEIQVVDEAEETLPGRCVGEICVRGPALMEGYLGRPRSFARTRDGRWFKTGDLGYVDDRWLFVTGRRKEMLIVHGRNFYVEDVEAVVSKDPRLYQSRCAAFSVGEIPEERIVVLAEARAAAPEAAGLAEELRAAVVRSLGVSRVEVHIVPPRTVRRTTSGKVQRVAMRKLLVEGHLADAIRGSSESAVAI